MNSTSLSRMTRRAAIFTLVATTFAIGAMAFALPGTADTPSTVLAADTTLGVDVETAGNSASTIGTIESCKSVNVGASFDVDLYVTDVTGMRAWEYFLAFDSSKIHVTAQSFQMITSFPESDPVPNSHSPHFIGSGGTAQVNGSGVLARMTFQADAAGVAIIAISHNPKWPALDSGNGKIGDTTGDGYFDGPLIAGSVAIGQDCPAGPVITETPGPTVAPPTPTPTPSPTPTTEPTAEPTATPAPPMRGDADCNGQIQLPDVIATLKGATGIGTAGSCSPRGDANCNGFLDANDALRELRFIAANPMAADQGCQPVGDPIPVS